jgi:integrase/recombinase XerD
VACVDEASAGSLGPFLDGFQEQLVLQGYAPESVAAHARLVRRLGRWLAREGIGARELTPLVVERFLEARRGEGSRGVSPGLKPLLGYLEGLGVLGVVEMQPVGETARLLGDYRRYLVGERGLAVRSVPPYMRVAERFLEGCAEPLCEDLDRVSGVQINAFVLAECEGHSAALGKLVVRGLRSFLRFLHVDGWLSRSLLEAVPRVARRESVLPRRALSVEQIGLLLGGCDRSTVRGSRDFAIVTVLSRLGLRAGEVTSLRLDDLDWRAGEILVRGKGQRFERMPLPSDVGAAIAEYLRSARPPSRERMVFLRTLAPLVGLSPGSVTGIVRSACEAAGVPLVGAHRLRHGVACELLREGAALPEIAQVLRHRSLLATSIYAKAEPAALRGLALAWPTGGRS